jgi:hypothetical protein
MPVNPANIAAQIVAAGPKPGGPAFAQFSLAVANGVSAWVAAGGVTLVGVATGVVGAGTVTGKYTVLPSPLPVAAGLTAGGVIGLTAPAIATAVGVGVGTALNTDAIYVGACGGVALGTDQVITVQANAATLTAALSSAMAGAGMVGPTVPQLASALAVGIAGLIMTGTGTGVVASVAVGPIPAVSASNSRLV